MEHRAKFIGIGLLCLAFGSEALTLGRLSGAAWVGRSLDITIPVQMNAGEAADTLCLKAEVFHADTRQEASGVSVTIEPSTRPQAATVRIRSSAPVDEPVVTVYLRAECGPRTTRRYVMLADMPSEVATAPAPSAIATPVRAVPRMAESGLPAVATQPGESSTAAVAKPPRKRARTSATPAAVSRQPEAAQSTARNATANKASATSRASGPRLKLDPLDFLSDRIADIDSYAPLAASPDALRNMQRMKTLEESVASLMALNAKNEANLLDLQARLKKAESNQYPDEVFYGLAVLLLACLAALALLWQRQRNSHRADENWWAASVAEPTGPETVATPVAPAVVPAFQPVKNATPVKSDSGRASEFFGHADAAHAVDVNLVEMSESGFDDLMQISPKNAGQRPPQAGIKSASFAPPMPDHGLDTEPLLDLLTQAEFFMSLGQADQASRLLTRQIAEAKHPNPFAYLKLLGIFHAHAERSNFAQLSHEFEARFNCRVPEFAIFKNEGRSLESYPTVLAAITAVWPKPESVQLLEACLVRESGESRGHPYDLAAFRDLIMLHSVASSLNQGGKPEMDDFGNQAPTAPATLDVARHYLSVDNMDYAGDIDIDLDLGFGLADSQMPEQGRSPLLGPSAHLPAMTPAAEDDSADAQWLDASVMPDDGNLIDFELPSDSLPTQPGGKKPAP